MLLGLPRLQPATAAEPVLGDFFVLRELGTGGAVGFECLEFSRRTRDERWLHSLPPLLGFLVRQSRPGEQVPLADILGAMWHHVKGSGLFDRAGRAPEDASAETPLPGYALAAG